MDSDPPTCNLDDPTTSHASISNDLLDAHVDAWLLASRQWFEESLEPETKHLRLDISSNREVQQQAVVSFYSSYLLVRKQKGHHATVITIIYAITFILLQFM